MTGVALVRRLWLILPVLALAVGCGSVKTVTVTTTQTVTATETTPAQKTAVRIYLLHDGKVAPVRRLAASTTGIAAAAVDELIAGPTAAERARGLFGAVPATARPNKITIADGVATLTLGDVLTREALGQLVYTLTQFSTVTAVEVDGKRWTRKSLEDVTPAILIESPLPGATVTSPLRLRGTANTFEANFLVEIDVGGNPIQNGNVTATSGSGTRGTFDTAFSFQADGGGPATLVAYEPSAADGSRTNVVEVPITLAP